VTNVERSSANLVGTGAWDPFKNTAFALLWTATLVSNVGTWMHDVGASWLMTELSPSPVVVAAVQAATTLPVFLFALPAGALADIVDRRRLLIVVNILLGAVAALLAVLVSLNAVTPTLLLVITFIMGTGAAFMAPAWQAIVPQLVPREQLPSAVALNSMGINVSRAIGPALAGFLIVVYGLTVPFAINALSVVAIVAALIWWRVPQTKHSALPAETVFPAMIAGVRYAMHSAPLKSTLLRAFAFFLFASAFWSLLPLIARQELQGGAALYGVLLACLGVGAVGGAVILSKIKSKLGADRTVKAATLGLAGVIAIFALNSNAYVAGLAALLAGVCWISVVSTLNVSAQTALPNWVRARGLSIFMMVFFGSMTVGSLLWGNLAAHIGISTTLLAAAAGALIAIPLTSHAKLNQGEGLDLSPSMHWPAPIAATELLDDRGPVAIQIVYQIEAADKQSFLELTKLLAGSRRRNGGYAWSIMEDAALPGRFVEHWQEASWLQHLRHHERVSVADREIQSRIAELHRGETSPTAVHMIAPR
jgi:MFS family permease